MTLATHTWHHSYAHGTDNTLCYPSIIIMWVISNSSNFWRKSTWFSVWEVCVAYNNSIQYLYEETRELCTKYAFNTEYNKTKQTQIIGKQHIGFPELDTNRIFCNLIS